MTKIANWTITKFYQVNCNAITYCRYVLVIMVQNGYNCFNSSRRPI